MKKILDFLIIFLFSFLVVSFLTGNKEVVKKEGIIFSTNKSNYTIPASVILNIENNTTNELQLNTCRDIKILSIGEEIKFDGNFCKDIIIKSGEKYAIDYSSNYSKFETVGTYTFKMNIGEKEYIYQSEIEIKGTFSKLFTAILYQPVYNLMIFLMKLFNGSLGWAIIIITIIVRIILLWPQHKMMLSQKKLQLLQPKIKKIQEEHKGNQQMIGMKLMDLYKNEKVNPMGSCGFLLIQMPILLVLYNIILYIKDDSNHYYIYSYLKSFDLNTISYNFFGIDLLSAGGITGLFLAIFVALVQFIQVKLSININKSSTKGIVLEKKKGDDIYSQFMPDPDVMNKFLLYGMPIMVGIFTYTLFSGIGVYWGMSTIFMIFQQIIVNKIIKK